MEKEDNTTINDDDGHIGKGAVIVGFGGGMSRTALFEMIRNAMTLDNDDLVVVDVIDELGKGVICKIVEELDDGKMVVAPYTTEGNTVTQTYTVDRKKLNFLHKSHNASGVLTELDLLNVLHGESYLSEKACKIDELAERAVKKGNIYNPCRSGWASHKSLKRFGK